MITMFERPFTNKVIKFARDYNWEVFHIHDQDSYENYRKIATGGGFPDLVLHRIDDQGHASMVVAELKTDADYSVVRPDQEQWLNAYKQFIPTFVWRPSDWEEVERVLRDGPPLRGSDSDPASPPFPVSPEEKMLPPRLWAIVNSLRYEIREQEFPRGDRASLRRMEIASPASVFWRISASRNLANIGGRDSDEKWASILQGIALLVEQDHGQPIGIGLALFRANYSERRFGQLLAARGPLLRTLMRRTFRMLARTEQTIYWPPVAELILNDGYNEVEAERVRRDIAGDYYRAMARANQPTRIEEEE